MFTEEKIALFMRGLSVAFPVIVCIVLMSLVGAVRDVASEIKTSSHTGLALPAGIYICDGDKCVIANSQNIDGLNKK